MLRFPLLLAFALIPLNGATLVAFPPTDPSDRSARVDKPINANSAVAPGKIRWHSTFAEACQASAKSGKPVLLFHMLGKLDQEFC